MGSVVSWQLKWNRVLLLAIGNVLPQTEQMTFGAVPCLLPHYLLKLHLYFIGTPLKKQRMKLEKLTVVNRLNRNQSIALLYHLKWCNVWSIEKNN